MKSSSIVLPCVPFCRFVVSMPSMMKRFSEPDEPSIWTPPARVSWFAPAAVETTVEKSRPFGMRSMVSWLTVVNEAACLTSIRGVSPVTSTVSVTDAIDRVMSTLSNWPRESAPDIFLVWKPGRAAVTSYVPGGRAGKR